MIVLKRAYEKAETSDGVRYLVERLWPRGLKKESLKVEAWLKEVAPSTKLRQWFDHDPPKWDEFRRRYHHQLRLHPETWQPIVEAARRTKVTLVYSSHDLEHNNAVALKEFLAPKIKARGVVRRAA